MELRSSSSAPLQVLLVWMVLMAACLEIAECSDWGVNHKAPGRRRSRDRGSVGAFQYAAATSCRAHTASLLDFGGVADGVTSNTGVFAAAMNNMSLFGSDGGGLLFVPPGRWLTGPFNLTSYFTLFLHHDAVILASQDISEWRVIDPLPSYGHGRDGPGGRYTSLIGGSNLTDVIITGDNGTIDGQGSFWWQKFHHGQLKFTRGYLLELMYSDQIMISNLTFLNSPAWNIHPVYSSNIVVSGITILAPVHSPNTDGINPDSCSNVRIEDCYIVSGDDCIAIKSGWDEYGIAFAMPSQHIVIRRLTCISPTSATIALGSEMSGGIQDVRAEDITAINTESAVRIKTAVGRGAYVKDIYVRRMTLTNMKWVFWMTGNYKSHADNNYDPNAIPVIQGISYSEVYANNATMVGRLEGITNASFTGICVSNVTVGVVRRKQPWDCVDVEGTSSWVSPKACPSLAEQDGGSSPCPFPEDKLPIEELDFKQCSYM